MYVNVAGKLVAIVINREFSLSDDVIIRIKLLFLPLDNQTRSTCININQTHRQDLRHTLSQYPRLRKKASGF